MDILLKIKEIKEYNEYILHDELTNKDYRLILEFYGIDSPQVGDFLLLHKNLLDPQNQWYSQPYAFEILTDDDSSLKEESSKIKDIDLAALSTKDKKYVLKRIYG